MKIGIKRSWVAVFAATALGVTLLAPTTVATAKELSPRQVNEKPISALKPGGTFIYAVNQMPDNFNTSHIDGNEAGVGYMQGTALPGVFTIDKYGAFVVDPLYASKAEVTSTSPQTITYTLNPKAKWSNGKSYGLADWVSHWKAVNGSNEAFEIVSSTGYEDIKSIKAGKNANEIVVVFSKTYADWQGLFSGILPAAVTATPAAFNTSWKTAPNASAGPFKYQGRDDTAKTVTYVRNPAWWGPKPVLEKIIFRSLPVASQIDALANGEVDHIDIGPSAPNFKRANGLPGVSVRVSVAPNYRHVTFGQKSEFMKDPLVRQAITAAVDRDAIARAMIGPMDPKVTSMDNHIFVKGLACYKNNSGALGEYNLQLADQLLDKAGWLLVGGKRTKNGVVMDLKVTIPAAVPTSAQEALMIVSMLKPLGIDLTVDVVPSDPFFDDYVLPGNYDMTIFTWLGTPLPISSASSIFKTDGDQNYGKIGSAAIDKLFVEANSVLDPDKRCAAVTKADALIWKLGHSIIMYQRPNIIGIDAKVANMGAWGFTSADWTKVGFVK
jgi:peptide/nickel transport system substrate-binding protein